MHVPKAWLIRFYGPSASWLFGFLRSVLRVGDLGMLGAWSLVVFGGFSRTW